MSGSASCPIVPGPMRIASISARVQSRSVPVLPQAEQRFFLTSNFNVLLSFQGDLGFHRSSSMLTRRMHNWPD